MSDQGTPISYALRLTALHSNRNTEVLEFDGYGLLRELLDDIEKAAEERGWFVDPEEPAA
jgi:hypothetical protein